MSNVDKEAFWSVWFDEQDIISALDEYNVENENELVEEIYEYCESDEGFEEFNQKVIEIAETLLKKSIEKVLQKREQEKVQTEIKN